MHFYRQTHSKNKVRLGWAIWEFSWVHFVCESEGEVGSRGGRTYEMGKN